MSIELCGQWVELLPEKAIYWRIQKTLFLSDIHLGKVNHFRKAGIAIPEEAGRRNYTVLQDILIDYHIEHVYILGDLFHSQLNEDWYRFSDFIGHYPSIKFHLVLGNHDILKKEVYDNSLLHIYEEPMAMGPFLLSHHPLEQDFGLYNLCGHIHPCIKLHGKSRQSLRLPCFYFGIKHGILPAFGSFTGTHPVKRVKGDLVYAIADGEILKIEQ